jgi:GNAT superfamily N-acetyltransferase
MSFSIRLASRTDAGAIFEMIRELARSERLEHEVTADRELLERNLFIEGRGAEVILATDDELPVGFALFFHNFSTFLGKPGIYLEDLFIRPAFRRRGYGKALMVYLARLALERDCGRFEWWVLDWNTDSLDFYRRLGAAPMSEWTVQRIAGPALHDLAGEPLLAASLLS